MTNKTIAELKAWANDRVDELHMHPKAVIEFYEILSRAEATKGEPLAVFKGLAVNLDKKTPCESCERFPLVKRGEDCACLWDTVVSATMFENNYREKMK